MMAAGSVLSVMLALLFLVVGAAKLARLRWARANADHLGFSVAAFQRVGALEVAGALGLAAGLFWSPLRVAAAVGLLALLVGAVWCQRRAGDGVLAVLPAVWVGVLTGVAVVLAW